MSTELKSITLLAPAAKWGCASLTICKRAAMRFTIAKPPGGAGEG